MTLLSGKLDRSTRATKAIQECVLVTGGGSGIGRAFALALGKRRQTLLLVGRDEASLRQVAAEIAALGGPEASHLAVDLTNPDAPLILLRHCWQNRLRVGTLINCAGMARRMHFDDQSWNLIRQTVDVNLLAAVRLTQLLLPRMIRRRSGQVITVSSMAAFEPSPDFAVYAAAKAFLSSFTASLREELSGSGVYVGLVCPGVTRTPFLRKAGIADEDVPDYAQTAEEVVTESLRAIDRHEALIIPGRHNRIRVLAQQASLRSAARAILRILRSLRARF